MEWYQVKTERKIRCDRCSGTGKVRVNVAAMCTSGNNWGTFNPEEMRICPECDGNRIVVEVTETVTTYRKLEDNEK
jgi:DnaJ-class molecular chaperone